VVPWNGTVFRAAAALEEERHWCTPEPFEGVADGDWRQGLLATPDTLGDGDLAEFCSVSFSMLTCNGPPVSSTDDRAAAFDGTRALAERSVPGLRPPETLPFHYSVIPYSGTRYHVVPAG
jgi:hypothetical protein